MLSAEQNTTGPKRCQLPGALAALLSNRQILHVQHVPECAEPRPESLATGPSSGSEAEKTIIGLDSKLLFQCFESLVVSKEMCWCAHMEKAGMKSRVSFQKHPAIPRVSQGALPGSGLPTGLLGGWSHLLLQINKQTKVRNGKDKVNCR